MKQSGTGPHRPSAPTSDDTATRRQSRERALSLLYEAEAKAVSGTDALLALSVPPDSYTKDLIATDAATRTRADTLIERLAVGWTIERMAKVDYLVLRLAVAELLMEDGPPVAVVIDEAVDLVSIYSTERSGAFVNGVLSTIASELGLGVGLDRGLDPEPDGDEVTNEC